MSSEVRRYYMEEELLNKTQSLPGKARSFMWYVGFLIVMGVAGVVVTLMLLNVV